MTATCTQCASPLGDGVRFCSACGTRVEEKRTAHSHYMTVLFCDLAGSTELTDQLGDERMFDLITKYQTICNEVVADHGGYVAKFMGDGMLAYFGYPDPLKNSANAAVSAALQIIERSDEISMSGMQVSASAGTATGWMVVGDANLGAAAAETMAIGGTVNLAARLQEEAGNGRVAVSAETGRRLDPAQFDLTPLGSLKLRGFSDPVQVWLVAAGDVTQNASTFVGRSALRSVLRDAWGKVQQDQVVSAVLQGPGGYGKTSLAESFLEEEVSENNVFTIRGQRHRREKSFAAFRPFIFLLAGISVSAPRTTQQAMLAAWAPEGALAGLTVLCELNDAPVSPLLRGPMIEKAILDVLAEQLPDSPTVLMLDDAHWLDADSCQLVGQIPKVMAHRSLMLLATRRPEGAELPLEDVMTIELDQMDLSEMDAIISVLDVDRVISTEKRAQIADRAAGVPLFVEHITQAVLERPDSQPEDTIPTTMIEALLERFANLGDSRELVAAAAILGPEVRVDILAAMLNSEQEPVYAQIAKLISRGLFRPGEDGSVAFDHALIREAVIDTLIKAHVQKLHVAALDAYAQIAPSLLPAAPVTAAYHLIGADRTVEAMPKLIEAAQTALAKGEIAEAVRVLGWAEDHLDQVPQGGGLRDDIEMMVKFFTGLALMQHRGFSDAGVAQAYSRALELCLAAERSGETEFQIAWGLWAHYQVVGEPVLAASTVARMDEIALAEPAVGVLAASARAVVKCNAGDLEGQEEAFAEVRKLYVPELHRQHAAIYSMDSLEMSHLFRIHGRYIAGDMPNWQAARADALEHEAFLDMPVLRPYIHIYGAGPNTYAHTDEEYRPDVAAAAAFAAEIGQPFWIIAGQVWLAHESVRNGDIATGTAALEAAHDQMCAIGLHLGRAYHSATLARCFALTGRAQDAVEMIDMAVEGNALGRDLLYAPEVLRLKAEVTILNDAAAGVPALQLLDEADEVATRMGTRAWSALIAASRARIMAGETGQDKAQAWLENRLASVVLPGSEAHPAFVTARRAFTTPI